MEEDEDADVEVEADADVDADGWSALERSFRVTGGLGVFGGGVSSFDG